MKKLLFIIFLFPGLLLSSKLSFAELPALGDPTQQELTPYREYLMGKSFYRTLRSSVPFIEDLEINDYISNLGRKLASHSDKPDTHFHFFIIKVPSINAFAGPDGYIGFHTGLITAARNESELAGVMAHEISHVTQRHLARAMTDTNTSPATLFATMLAGILVASQNPQAGAALIYGGQAAYMQSQINFTRANEHEADRIGIGVLRDSGINPEGMAIFFETLLRKSESNNVIAQMEYLRTHPLSTTRVAEARNRITEQDYTLPDDSLNFQFTRARILVDITDSIPKLIKQLDMLDTTEKNIVTQYTLALAHTKNKQAAQAIKLLQKLTKKSEHPWVKLALVDAYVANKNIKTALKTLETLNTLYPNYLPASIRYAKLLLKQKQIDKTILLLNQQLRSKKHPVVYNTLAKAYFAKGQVSLALEATSYEYELEGYLKLAAQQVNNALQQPQLNKTTVQRLQARKKSLTNQIHRETREQH